MAKLTSPPDPYLKSAPGVERDIASDRKLVDEFAMQTQQIRQLLRDATSEIERAEQPENFDFEVFFLSKGCEARMSTLLADYLVCACGRGIARELGMGLSDTYQRRLANGSWSHDLRYDADPIWLVVEEFVETIRSHQNSRRQFSLIAQHSAEVDAINRALNSGETLEGLKGANFSGVFNTSL